MIDAHTLGRPPRTARVSSPSAASARGREASTTTSAQLTSRAISAAAGRAEVDGDTSLPCVHHVEEGCRTEPRPVRSIGRFDLHDGGARVGEDASAQRACPERREVDHPHLLQITDRRPVVQRLDDRRRSRFGGRRADHRGRQPELEGRRGEMPRTSASGHRVQPIECFVSVRHCRRPQPGRKHRDVVGAWERHGDPVVRGADEVTAPAAAHASLPAETCDRRALGQHGHRIDHDPGTHTSGDVGDGGDELTDSWHQSGGRCERQPVRPPAQQARATRRPGGEVVGVGSERVGHLAIISGDTLTR